MRIAIAYYAFNHSGKARKITCRSGCHLSSLHGPKQRQQHATSVGQGLMATQLFVRKKTSPHVIQWPWPSYPHNNWRSRKKPLSSGHGLLKHPKKGPFFSQNCEAIDFQDWILAAFFFSGSLYLMSFCANEIIPTKNWNRISSPYPKQPRVHPGALPGPAGEKNNAELWPIHIILICFLEPCFFRDREGRRNLRRHEKTKKLPKNYQTLATRSLENISDGRVTKC